MLVKIEPIRQPNRILRHKPSHLRIVVLEGVVAQLRLIVEVLALEPQVLLDLAHMQRFQPPPGLIGSLPDNAAVGVGHFQWGADLVGVVIEHRSFGDTSPETVMPIRAGTVQLAVDQRLRFHQPVFGVIAEALQLTQARTSLNQAIPGVTGIFLITPLPEPQCVEFGEQVDLVVVARLPSAAIGVAELGHQRGQVMVFIGDLAVQRIDFFEQTGVLVVDEGQKVAIGQVQADHVALPVQFESIALTAILTAVE